MTRPALTRLGCLLTAGAAAAGSALLAPGPAAADEAGGATPLRVTIETLAPAVVPQRGPVTLTGRIVNRSQQTWTDLNVYLVTSATPIRSRSELDAEADTDATTQVGSRQTTEGLYDRVGDLAPGESVPYRLSVPRDQLGISGGAGVYWVGAHVLGAQDGMRDSTADGRARTFMPLMPRPGSPAAQRARTRLAVVVPFKEPAHRGASGRLLDLPGWHKDLGTDGRLDRLLRLGSRSTEPVTWAVDPAVLDATASLAHDNPPFDLGPADGRSAGGGGTRGPSGTPSPTPSPSPGSGDRDPGPAAEPSTAAVAAQRWLAEFRRQAPQHTVTALPYGDLDIASVLAQSRADRVRSLYPLAGRLSRSVLADYGVERAAELVAPAGGVLPAAALRRISPGSTVLLRRSALPDALEPVVSSTGQAPVVLADESAGSGGPSPNSQFAALPMRQRLLSDAALHALSTRRDEPLVVSMPSYWNPGDAWATSRFFSGLSQRWLQLVDLPSVVATASTDTAGEDTVAYPEVDRLGRVPLRNLSASLRLVDEGKVFTRLLTGSDAVDDAVARTALLGSSTDARLDPALARSQVADADASVRAQMGRVRVEGPGFVMMSGESGPIQVTLVNGLEQSVTVGLAVTTPGSGLRLKPVVPVTLGPGRRTSIRLEASSNDIGVHPVTLRATDRLGTPLGGQTRFTVRTSNVSTVIWVVMAIAGGLLFLAIVVRLVRRVRRRNATHGPVLPPDSVDRPGQELNA